MALPLPDEPRWVEAHGIAADPASWQRTAGRGFVVGNDRAQLAVASPDADPEALAGLARELPAHTILAPTRELARGTQRECVRAILHTLPEPDALPDLEGAVPLGLASLEHVPPALADELRAQSGTIWAAFVDGEPVSFAHAPWRSARWFDISVDTLPGARQLGLGTIVAAAMIRHERAEGREPVWGADEDNRASLALARRLGFVAVDELWVAAPTGARS